MRDGLSIPEYLARAVQEDGREEWLATLPHTIKELESRWTVTAGEPFQRGGRTAWVAPVTGPGGDSGGGPCDPVGGCQDPEWPNELITTETTQTGAIAHVVFIDGSNVFKTDLVIITSGAQLLVDDIYCTGQDPSTTDAYASGWDVRSVCQGA